jgi:3-phenylpropionate/trans-cinnamate dioxygenase ferredoxin reductase subunit
MGPHERFVILGAGLAGARAATAIRQSGFDGSITVVGDEIHLPYLRPPLSKAYLQGEAGADSLLVHPGTWYADHEVALMLGTTAHAIDFDRRGVELSNGERLPFDALLLATGSRARRLTVPGADADGVLYLRRLPDSDRLRDALAGRPSVVVIGAGWIGLEVASAARLAGCDVTVVESERLPLLRVLGPELATFIADLHAHNGVTFRFGATVESLTASNGRVTGVRLDTERVIRADTVVVGIGAVPNIEYAESSPLRIDNGIVVDEYLRTNQPRVFAAGDVANAFHPTLARSIRVEHWATAHHQGHTAGLNMAGRREAYERLPFFYSDQYDVSFEYVGTGSTPGDYDQLVIRGSLQRREFISFWLSEGRVVAGMNANTWNVSDAIERIISTGRIVDISKLADPDVSLATLATA